MLIRFSNIEIDTQYYICPAIVVRVSKKKKSIELQMRTTNELVELIVSQLKYFTELMNY